MEVSKDNFKLDSESFNYLKDNLVGYETVQDWFVTNFVSTSRKKKQISGELGRIMKKYFCNNPTTFYRFIDDNAEVHYMIRVSGSVKVEATGSVSMDDYESGNLRDKEFRELLSDDDEPFIWHDSLLMTDTKVMNKCLKLSDDFMGKDVGANTLSFITETESGESGD